MAIFGELFSSDLLAIQDLENRVRPLSDLTSQDPSLPSHPVLTISSSQNLNEP